MTDESELRARSRMKKNHNMHRNINNARQDTLGLTIQNWKSVGLTKREIMTLHSCIRLIHSFSFEKHVPVAAHEAQEVAYFLKVSWSSVMQSLSGHVQCYTFINKLLVINELLLLVQSLKNAPNYPYPFSKYIPSQPKSSQNANSSMPADPSEKAASDAKWSSTPNTLYK